MEMMAAYAKSNKKALAIIFNIFSHIYYLSQLCGMILEEQQQLKNFACLHRKDIDVEMSLKKDSLHLDITSYKKREFYNIVITDKTLSESENCKNLLENVGSLFTELLENRTLEFTDNNILTFFVSVAYKSTKLSIKIEFSANLRQFKDDAEKNETIFRKLQRLNSFGHLIPELIPFQGDESNINYQDYNVSQDKRIVTGPKQQYSKILNHCNSIPKTGIFFFKIKIKQSKNGYMQLGICGRRLREQDFSESIKTQEYIAWKQDGQIVGGNNSIAIPMKFTIKVDSVFTVEIDMNKKWISWYHNDDLFATIAIFQKLLQAQIYPIIVLDKDMTVELIHK